MLKAIKNWKSYVFALIMALIACLISYLPMIIIDRYFPEQKAPFDGNFLVLGIAVIYILIGYVVSNAVVNRYRKQSKNYESLLPPEIIDKKWVYRWPFLIGGALTLVAGFLIYLIFYAS
ncbi:MAG: hypothetical protein LBR37_02610 [Erysipelotrichaceae bacterium]|jgi:branched-subunit amino acid ABC-type transport system permease component|nr:hypothetical protein [Erysipelotrichaceae bacterium]